MASAALLSTGLVVPTTRSSWESSTLNGINSLSIVEAAVPLPSATEVLISVRAIGLNYADVFVCQGVYDAANKALAADPERESFCPGLEFSGVVLQAGDACSAVRAGDRVYGFARFGAYRTAVVVAEKHVRKLPDAWSFAEGAALVAQGCTAWHGLVQLGRAQKGERALIHSAAGGVGSAALSICKSLGLEATAVVGSESKVKYLEERFPDWPGLSILVRGKEKEYGAQLKELGYEYDLCLESLGGKYLTGALDSLAPMGRLLHFGATHSYGGAADGLRKWLTFAAGWLSRPLIDPGALVPKNIAVIGFNLIWLTERDELMAQELEDMLTKGGLGDRPPAVGAEFEWARLPDALEHLKSGKSVGKVVVTVDS